MKKEVFLAIAIGFALGLVITFGIWTANKSLASLNTSEGTPTPTLSQDQSTGDTNEPTNNTPTTSSGLIISSPEDELLTNKNSIEVTGKAQANSTVVIASENNEQVLSADAAGNFSATVTLIAGYNLINVVAFDAQGVETSQTLTITYSTANI